MIEDTICCSSRFFFELSCILGILFSPIPLISSSRSVWFTKISKVFSLNLATIISALFFEIPAIFPCCRYVRILFSSAGITFTYASTLNPSPYFGWSSQFPDTKTLSPSSTSYNWPLILHLHILSPVSAAYATPAIILKPDSFL